jgi:pyruvate,water dikinase
LLQDSLESLNEHFIIPLSHITRANLDQVGSKAANLGEMQQAGFRVPNGFVLTTDSFELFMTANGLDNESTQDDVANASIPPEIEAQLQIALAPFNKSSLAVRSSGVAEDLAESSFAGQYETVLGVQGFDAIISAVRLCWASVFNDRVSAYLAEKGEIQKKSMAVLVQQLVEADVAGVAFSVNPVTGDRDECVINAVNGLGERLVSGHATPDEWVVRGNKAVSISSPENAITIVQAIEVAEMARQAESYFGAPQDVEWAIKDGELFMLQARPITALPEHVHLVPVSIDPPPGFWVRETEHFTEPLSPLFRTTLIPRHEKAIFEIMEEYSVLIDGVQFREIGGWLYTRVVPLGGKELPPPPAWLSPIIMPIIIRLIPSMRKRVNGLVNVYRTNLPSKNIEKWYNEWKPNNIKRINQFKLIDLKTLSDEQLEQHLKLLLDFMAENSKIHARVTAADFLIADFILTSKRILEWDEMKSLELLSGLSIKTTEPTKRLDELAQIAKEKPAILQMLNNINFETVEKLSTVDVDFAEAFDNYMNEFGARTLTYELIKKALDEQPELVLKLINDHLNNDYNFESKAAVLDEKREKIVSKAKQTLSNKTYEEQEEFELALAKAERVYPAREDHEYYLHNAPLALLRKLFLEIGNRFKTQGYLERADDIFFLELDEVLSGFSEGSDKLETVIRRKGELAWAKVNPGPISYGGPPLPPPSMEGFPAEVKRVMEGMVWMLEGNSSMEYLQQKNTDSPQALTGIAASPGNYTGPVRIIMSEEEFHKLEPGDVLVCPTTQPPWSVLFPSVGALVTDGGGILSHPAIIAREYQVPAVVATGNATKVLRDDMIVTVNGNDGSISITPSQIPSL